MFSNLTNWECRFLSSFIIFFSTLGSLGLANSVDTSHYELGALFNEIVPWAVGLVTIIMFLIFSLIVKRRKFWKVVLIICCLYNIYVEFAFHLNKEEFWPLIL